MNPRIIIATVGAAMAAAGVSLAAPPDATFTSIGVLPNGTGSGALDVSGDGRTVVGWGRNRDGTLQAIRWVAHADGGVHYPVYAGGGELRGLGWLQGVVGRNDPISEAHGVSFDGSVIVGMSSSALGIEAFRWTSMTAIEGLGDLPSDNTYYSSIAYDVSDDGETVVGAGAGVFCDVTGEAFVWTPTTAMVGLGLVPAGRMVSSAQGVSSDGTTIVGWGQTGRGTQAIKWKFGVPGFVELGDLPGGAFESRAYGISGDAGTIVGTGAQVHDQQAVAWYRNGEIVDLGQLPAGSIKAEALDASADGSVIVGVMYTDKGDEAFVWDALHGVRPLTSLLADGSWLDVAEWQFLRANGVSADGMTVVGEGISPDGRPEGWVAYIRCAADINADFVADRNDLVMFYELANAGDIKADCNLDGIVNIVDFICFYQAFQAGCP
jgi:uncharacterized membrane protein